MSCLIWSVWSTQNCLQICSRCFYGLCRVSELPKNSKTCRRLWVGLSYHFARQQSLSHFSGDALIIITAPKSSVPLYLPFAKSADQNIQRRTLRKLFCKHLRLQILGLDSDTVDIHYISDTQNSTIVFQPLGLAVSSSLSFQSVRIRSANSSDKEVPANHITVCW